MRRGVVLLLITLGVLIATWLVVVFAYWRSHEQHLLGVVGDSFAPVGALITIAALVFAFDQRHTDANRAHKDAERAHRDRLADSYARWFDFAWTAINDARDSIAEAIKEDSIPKIRFVLERMPEWERKVRLAAVPTLMIERDANRASRLRETQVPFSAWPGGIVTNDKVGEYRAFAKTLAEDLAQRRTRMEELLEDVGKSLVAIDASRA